MVDPKKQYRTRDGREVRIYAVDGGEHEAHSLCEAGDRLRGRRGAVMSNLSKPVSMNLTDRIERTIQFTECTNTVDLLRECEEEISKLRSALEAVDEALNDAAQDDCENGVKWLNEKAAEGYLKEYPHTSAAISKVINLIRAALGGDK